MKDFLGQELRVGDNVVIIATSYGSSTELEQGKITKINKVMATVEDKWKNQGAKHPSKILKIDTILNNLENQK